MGQNKEKATRPLPTLRSASAFLASAKQGNTFCECTRKKYTIHYMQASMYSIFLSPFSLH